MAGTVRVTYYMNAIGRSTAVHTSVEETKDFLDMMIESREPKSTVIGIAGIWDDDEIGFIFNREYWGKGYASEALQVLLNKFWTENKSAQGLVKADADPRNESCIQLLKKFGFVEVGRAKNTFETHIGWCDSVYLEAKKPNALK
ncbi:acyl-CoA N-acyltransferase [Gymnopilus junonius]|uniref:Acyl-CoA N-acyltransferase n=1 Tax=Gymnopilus junonius TaxID=109634 RepID=A0A9P5NIB5_GYMJU|nr:acyl-CoA N-acyltransferase [Gymnopilus junonius]